MIAVAAALTFGSEAQAPARPASNAAEPLSVNELVAVNRLTDLLVSPDGRLAVVRVVGQSIDANALDLAWHVVDLADGRSSRLAEAGEPIWNPNGGLEAEAPQWSADSRRLYYRALHGEEVALWRADVATLSATKLTSEAADVLAFAVDPDGQIHVALAGATREEIKAAELGERDTGVLVDSTIITGFPVHRGFPVHGRMATVRYPGRGPSSSQVGLLASRPATVLTLDPATLAPAPAAPAISARFQRPWRARSGVRFFEQGAARFVPSDVGAAAQSDASTASLVESSGSAGEGAPRSGLTLTATPRRDRASTMTCSDPACMSADDIALLGWTPDHRGVVFQTVNGAQDALHVWTPGGRVRSVTKRDGVVGSGYSGQFGRCQLAGWNVICISADATMPPRLIGIDLRSGRERVLYDPNPTLTSERFGLPGTLTVTDRLGRRAFARVLLPRNHVAGERLPLVITSYSCRGFLMGGSGEDVPEHILVGLGYAVACLDLTSGSVQSDRPVSRSQAMIASGDFLEEVIAELDHRGLVDPARVAVAGYSGSTNIVTAALTRTRAFTAAIATTNGSPDIIVCYLNAHTGQCRRLAESEGFAPPHDARSGRWASSPAWNAEKITTPLLMQLAEVEHRSMMQLYAGMSEYGRAVEMRVFPDAYHYKHLPRQRQAVYERNIDWIEFWLRGKERVAGDQEQYARWRAMRLAQCRIPAVVAPPAPWYCAGDAGAR